MDRKAGFREIEHTADWELQVWGPDIISLLDTAARGMYVLAHTQLASNPRFVRDFEIPFIDQESLLVDFLSELLFLGEDEEIAFDSFKLKLCTDNLKVQASGAPIQNQAKEIKAVTYHDMQIRETERGLVVNIVFDV